jgi:lipoprotein-anchoring transpeptidase ErfK/SrfK
MLQINHTASRAFFGAVVISAALMGSATAQPLALADPSFGRASIFDQVIREQVTTTEDQQEAAGVPARLRRQMVIGVGRDGFTWSGVQSIARKTEWPDWTPPAEMLQRQPYLPRFMAGGPGNPLGARAMYLGNTIYRIHGTNQPSTIGGHVSSGCIRMVNEDVMDLYDRVQVGAKVVVLPSEPRRNTATPVVSRVAPAPMPMASSTRGRPSGLY